uniref:Inositol monophosphatase n=2 Tax=unclassified bacterial viruses TaxID=12333 RepID=A0AAU7J893_9VIRU
MRDRELFALMAEAAASATRVCLEKGYTRWDRVTTESARAAADAVYRRERPEEFMPKVSDAAPVEDGWRDRADVGG